MDDGGSVQAGDQFPVLRAGANFRAVIGSIQSISGAKTIAATDNGSLIRCTANLNIQLDGVAAKTRFEVVCIGAIAVTFSAGSGMTINGFPGVSGDGAVATLVQISATVWEIYGPTQASGLNTGLFAFYPMDESASGTTVRDVFGGETATAGTAAAGGVGKTRLAAKVFTNSASQVFVTSTASGDLKFNRGAGALQISAWVKLVSLATSTHVATLFVTTGNKRVWLMDITTGGKARFGISTAGTSANVLATSTPTLVTGTWYHLVGYYNPTTGKAGIIVNNGTADEATASAGMFVTTGIGMCIGGQESVSSAQAALQDIGFWSRNLTAAEIATLYNAGVGRSYPFIP
jgi:hypothetical protein